MSVENKFSVGAKVKWNDYDYWQGFHREDVGFEDILTVVGYVDGPLVELQSDSGVAIGAFDWRFELVEDAPNAQDNSWYEKGELPPIGANIEYKLGAGPWFEATVKYVLDVLDCDEDGIVIACPHLGFEQLLTLNERNKIRPIKTPEQIAKQEREAYCDRIYGILCKAERKNNRSDMAEALYDAGLRFVGEDF